MEKNNKAVSCNSMPQSSWAASWIATKKSESDSGAACAARVKDQAQEISDGNVQFTIYSYCILSHY